MFPRKLPSASFAVLLCPCSIQYYASRRLISATRPPRTNLMAVTSHSLEAVVSIFDSLLFIFLLSAVDPRAAHLKYVDLFAFVVDDESIHSIGSYLLMLCINAPIPTCLNATRLLQGFIIIIIIIIIFIVFISIRTTFYWFACVLLWHWYWATLGLLILWERIWFFHVRCPPTRNTSIFLRFSSCVAMLIPLPSAELSQNCLWGRNNAQFLHPSS